MQYEIERKENEEKRKWIQKGCCIGKIKKNYLFTLFLSKIFVPFFFTHFSLSFSMYIFSLHLWGEKKLWAPHASFLFTFFSDILNEGKKYFVHFISSYFISFLFLLIQKKKKKFSQVMASVTMSHMPNNITT